MRLLFLIGGSYSGNYQIGKLDKKIGMKIVRADLADFMLGVLPKTQTCLRYQQSATE